MRNKNIIKLVLVLACVPALLLMGAVMLQGCVSLDPGADPLIVNVERVEQDAAASFDLVLHMDHSDRNFWRSNAPAFHSFCEWLRQPQPIDQTTNTLPRCLASVKALDNIKLDYKTSKVSSNVLVSSLAVLQGMVREAAAWSTVLTTNTSRTSVAPKPPAALPATLQLDAAAAH